MRSLRLQRAAVAASDLVQFACAQHTDPLIRSRWRSRRACLVAPLPHCRFSMLCIELRLGHARLAEDGLMVEALVRAACYRPHPRSHCQTRGSRAWSPARSMHVEQLAAKGLDAVLTLNHIERHVERAPCLRERELALVPCRWRDLAQRAGALSSGARLEMPPRARCAGGRQLSRRGQPDQETSCSDAG